MTKAALFGLVLSFATAAGAQTAIPTEDRGRVLIEYTGPTQLSNAFAVMRIRIANRSGKARTWRFEFFAVGASYAERGRQSSFELEVENDHDRRFEILVPLAESTDASWVQMVVFGHGLVNTGQMEVVTNTVSSRVAASEKAVLRSPEVFEQLAADPAGAGNVRLPFPDVDVLSGDWRAYSGLSVLWLSAEEWRRADPSVRRALMDWVASGGRLVLVAPGDGLKPAPVERRGMGTIVTIPEGLSSGDASRVERELPPEHAVADSISWVTSLIEPIDTHKGLLSFVLLGYLVLAGPVNLFVLSPGAKRVRLFWTMPAIALGASAVMAVVILFQDGVGGQGYRANLVYLEPELNRELIVQEQVSRSGALVGRSFVLEEPVVVRSLPTAYHPHQSASELVSSDGNYSGDWYRSRSIQAHRLDYRRSSRARIDRVAFDQDGPTILSSIDVALETLYFRDQQGRIWVGEYVVPGRPVRLGPSSEEAYEEFYYRTSFTTAGPAIRARAAAIRSLPGTFLAVAAEGTTGVAVETLPSIDWTDGPVLYAGPIGARERAVR